MIVIMMIIASYTNDDDLHHYDYRIVHIVFALAMYDAANFCYGRTRLLSILSFSIVRNYIVTLE